MTDLPPATTPSRNEPKTSRPFRVAEAIKSWVVEQGLAPGDRLPPEAELIERFGVSKGTVREAMRLLEAQGLIKTRTGPGGGSFVHKVSRQRTKALLANYFYFKNLSIDDIYELRLLLEPKLAASLAGKLAPEVIDELEAVMASYARPSRTLEEERAQHVASLRFHAILAEQARNPLLGLIIDFMVTLLSDLTVYRRLYSPRNLELWRQGLDHQSRLIAALKDGNAAAAEAIMAEHMQIAWQLMRAQEAVIDNGFISSI